MARLAVFAMILLLVGTSCTREERFRGRKINFVAKSTGYMAKTGGETKTAYTGKDENVGTVEAPKYKERLDWTRGDLIYIYCASATNQGDNSNYAEYGVDKVSTESDAVSKASIQPTDFANSMTWGDSEDPYDFYAMYPSPKDLDSDFYSFTAGTMKFKMPAAYPVADKTAVVTKDAEHGIVTVNPDMNYAPMLAAQTVASGASSVPLPFTPQFSAFEITIDKASFKSINLSQFRIYGASEDKLSGTFTVNAGAYGAVASYGADVTNTVTLDLNGDDEDETDDIIILDGTYPTLTLTVLTVPGAFTNGITIEFTGKFTEEIAGGSEIVSTQTRKLTLKDNVGDFVEFAPYKKYRIYGLSFPMMIDANIDDGIAWNYNLEILDGIVWWMNADMHNYIYWTTDINMDAYANLPDDVKWFTTTGITQDFAWEEFRNIALNDESDMYLWKGQTGSRTVSAFNRDGNAYFDYSLEWSVEQTGKVISLNGSTGEITAKNPGVAIVKATATPGDGSAPQTVAYNVYVNAPTGITLTAAKDFVKPSGTVGLTATLTCTSYGTPSEYPADMLEWSSANESYITVTGEAQPDMATGEASGLAEGLAEGSSTITVSVAAKYADGISASLTDFPCEDRTEIDLLTYGGEKYKFRNLSLSPGILKYVGSSATYPSGYTLTDGSDPLELLKHYYHDNNGGEDLNVYYHVWAGTNSLAHRLMHDDSPSYDGEITQTITIGGTTWRIPSGGAADREWNLIINDTHKKDITINTVGYPKSSSATGNYIRVVVDLTGANDGNGYDYSIHGLTNATISTSDGKQYVSAIASPSDHLAGTFGYQAGVLLIPDGAIISCRRINSVPGVFFSSSYGNTNLITFSDLIILTEGGCVFLPAAGFYSSYSSHNYWNDGGKAGYYWSRNISGNSSYFLRFSNNYAIEITDSSRGKDNSLFPVKLVHD